MKKLIVIVFCCFFLCCRDSADKENGTAENLTTVTIVPQEPFPVAKFIEDIRVLPLESDGKHLIGAVDNLLFTRERIVVSDQRLSKCVYIFDYDGKIKAVIDRQGRGPGEYISPSYTTLTPDSSRIAIYDNFGSKVLFFDLEGRFLEHKEVSFWFNKFEYIDKDHVVCTTYGADDPGLKKADMQGNLMIFTDGDFRIETGGLRNMYGERPNFPFLPELKKINGDVFLTPAFSDTVYKVGTGSLEPYYHVDISAIGGVTHMDAGISRDEYEDLVDHNNFFSGRFLENDSFALFIFTENREIKERIFDKRTQKVYSLTRDSKVNNPFRISWFDVDLLQSKSICDNRFVAVVPAYYLLMGYSNCADDYPQLAGLKEESNPVLVFYKLKDPDKTD